MPITEIIPNPGARRPSVLRDARDRLAGNNNSKIRIAFAVSPISRMLILRYALRYFPRPRPFVQIVRDNDYNGDPLIRDWGLEVAPQMMRVPARVLPAPELEYRNQQRISNPGKWNLMQGGAKVSQA